MLTQARAIADEIVKHRRHIHANPELSFLESETAKYAAETMRSFGYTVRTQIGGTGLIAEIGDGAQVIGIRADMDALPISEANDADYCSKNEGVMHACGHDAHTACALGAARLIAERLKRGQTQGRFRFLFQPAEEKTNEEGRSGAVLMMNDGAVDGLSALIALHVHVAMPVGSIGLASGAILAACDSFEIKIVGKGTHGAMPELGCDPIVLSANVVQALQTIVSRSCSPVEPLVLTIGGIKSETYAPNVVADSVSLTGTIRYFDATLSAFCKQRMQSILSMVQPLGGNAELRYINENPPLVNDPRITAFVEETAADILGPDSVIRIDRFMAAEDFSFYTNRLPCCYFLLGAAIDGDAREFHTSRFDIDEGALPIGSAMLAESAMRLANAQAIKR